MPAYNTAKDLPHAKDHLTVAEVAAKLGVSEALVRLRIREGRLGAYKRTWLYGRTPRARRCAYFIPIDELKRYLLSKVVEKYGGPIKWHPPSDSPDAILKEGQ